MRSRKRFTLPFLAFVLAVGIAVPLAALAAPKDDTADRPHSQNMHLIGSSLRAGAVTGPPPAGPGTVPWDTRNTDLAFWGDRAIQGRYDGFRVIDIKASGNPKELAFFTCVSPQGDVGVYGNLVFRSVDSPQQTDQCASESQSGSPTDCAPVSSPCTGFEGIQIFDISNLNDIQHVASVALDCGSHTHTVVPDTANGRVLIYNSVSGTPLQTAPGKYGNQCPGQPFGREDIVEVPLDDPASSSVIGSFGLGELDDGTMMMGCHDFGVVMGDADLGACAGHPRGVSVFDISDPENPVFKYAVEAPTVTGWHSAAFNWTGTVLVTGWEPGGGTRPRCQETGALDGSTVVTDEMKTLFFYDTATGEMIGRHVLPRPQSQYENCTVHNYNIAPHPTRNLLVHGSYQSGTALVDFTDTSNIYEVAWMDPLPLDPPTETSPGGRSAFRGGDWSSYWYNGRIYESDTRRGLYVWKVSAPEVGGPFVKLDFLNPQTNHLSITEDSRGSTARGKATKSK